MYVVVPLAGPDIFLNDGSFRPLYDYGGDTMINKILKSRHWFKKGEATFENLIFVLRDVPKIDDLLNYLKNEFPGCKYTIISELTGGALLSTMAGAALIKDYDRPICVDLVDIDYQTEFSPVKFFANHADISGVLLTFESTRPEFSYLKMNGNFVGQCVEKKVISNIASAGTYFFRDLLTFLTAARGSVRFNELVCYKEALFLCPSFNFISVNGMKVTKEDVRDIVSISSIFKKI